MLTLSQKSDVRRHLMYPVGGLPRLSPSGGTLADGAAGWRFTQAFGFLEYKMNNLAPDEEARLTGAGIAAVAIVGNQPNPGDMVTVTLSGGPIPTPQILTATMPSGVSGDGRLILAQELANAAAMNPVLTGAGVLGVAPFGTGPFAESGVPMPEVAFTAPASFMIAVGFTGSIAPQITASGAQLSPSTSLDGIVTLWGYLPILDGLEFAHATASQNLDTLVAGPWRARSNEIGYRTSLYRHWQQKMSEFLGTPLNPQKFNQARTVGAMRYL